jgi:hypothetical protein
MVEGKFVGCLQKLALLYSARNAKAPITPYSAQKVG